MANRLSDGARSLARLITRGSTAFGRGLEAASAEYDQPGPAPKVSPFEPGTVSGGAIALKSLAALIAGRRASANARQERMDKARVEAYRNLQMENLRSQIADREKPDAPKAPTPVQRMHIAADDPRIPKLGSYNPADGTVEVPEYSQLATQGRFDALLKLRKDAEGRLATGQETRETRLENARALVEAKAGWDALDKEVGAEAETAAAAAQREADVAARVLRDPYGGLSEADRAQPGWQRRAMDRKLASARLLGVGGMRHAADDPANKVKAGDVMADPVLGAGSRLYDIRALNDQIKAFVGARKSSAEVAARKARATRYDIYKRVLDPSATGNGAPADDPLLKGADDLIRLYTNVPAPAPTSAPEDSSGYYDEPWTKAR